MRKALFNLSEQCSLCVLLKLQSNRRRVIFMKNVCVNYFISPDKRLINWTRGCVSCS